MGKKKGSEDSGLTINPMKLIVVVSKGGPWTLIVVYALASLAAEYGFIPSQSKILTAQVQVLAGKVNEMEGKCEWNARAVGRFKETLRKICLQGAKTTADATECASL